MNSGAANPMGERLNSPGKFHFPMNHIGWSDLTLESAEFSDGVKRLSPAAKQVNVGCWGLSCITGETSCQWRL